MKKIQKLIACVMAVVLVLTGITVANVFAGSAQKSIPNASTNMHGVGECTSTSVSSTQVSCPCQYKFSGNMTKGSVSLMAYGKEHTHSWTGNATYTKPCSVCGFTKTSNNVSIKCSYTPNKQHSWGTSTSISQSYTSSTTGKTPSCKCAYKVSGNMNKGSISLYVRGQKHTHNWTNNKQYTIPCTKCGFTKNANSVSFKCGSDTNTSHNWGVSKSQTNNHSTTSVIAGNSNNMNSSCSCCFKTTGNMTKGSISLYIKGQKHTHTWTNGKIFNTPCKTCGFTKTRTAINVKCATSSHGWKTVTGISNSYSSNTKDSVSTNEKFATCSCQFTVSGTMKQGSMSLYVKGQRHTHSWTNDKTFNTPCKTCGFTKTNNSVSVNCGRGVPTKHGYSQSATYSNSTTNSQGVSSGTTQPIPMFNCGICNRYHCALKPLSQSTSVGMSSSQNVSTSNSIGESWGSSVSQSYSVNSSVSSGWGSSTGVSQGSSWSESNSTSSGVSHSTGTSSGTSHSTSQTIGTSVGLSYCSACGISHCRY